MKIAQVLFLVLCSCRIASAEIIDIDNFEFPDPIPLVDPAVCDQNYWACLGSGILNSFECQLIWESCLQGVVLEIEVFEEIPVEEAELFEPPVIEPEELPEEQPESFDPPVIEPVELPGEALGLFETPTSNDETP